MSQLAQQLANAVPPPNARKGPLAACEVYGPGDHEDCAAIEALLSQGLTWAAVQTMVDEQIGIERRIKNDHFRYHWRRKCSHWDEA